MRRHDEGHRLLTDYPVVDRVIHHLKLSFVDIACVSQVILDLLLSRNLYFLTMVGGANCHKEARSADTAKKETLILPKEHKK
jgi:hypothetical protein